MPRPRIGDEPTQRRPDDRGEPEDPGQYSLVLAALRGREQVADRYKRDRHHGAATKALERPEADQLDHSLRKPREGRSDQEDDHPGDAEPLAAVHVGKPSHDWNDHRRRHHVRGCHPRVQLEPTQVRDDPRERGADDGLVQRGQEQRHHHAAHGQDDLPPGQLLEFVFLGLRGRAAFRYGRLHFRVRLQGAFWRRGVPPGACAEPAESAYGLRQTLEATVLR